MRTSFALASSVLVLAGSLGAAPAHGATTGQARPVPVPGCGAVLTTDARLVADLTCAAGDGLVLAAGVTLDLRGHTLRGGGTGRGIVVPGHGDVTVRNGTVAGWDSGVVTDHDTLDDERPSGTVTVTRVTFSDNRAGIDPSGVHPGAHGKPHVVTRSTFTGNDRGVSAWFADVTVSGSTFRDNDVALHLDTGVLSLERSRLERNGTGLSCYEAGCSLRDSTVVDNTLGVTSSIFDMVVSRTTFVRNGTAYRSYPTLGHDTIEASTFRDNGIGIELERGNATLTGNELRGNEVAIRSAGEAFDPDVPVDVVLVGNRLVRNGDAILVEHPGASLQDNVANDNRRWGIHAPGAVDLGGNQARGNGNEPQCVGVVCGSRPRS